MSNDRNEDGKAHPIAILGVIAVVAVSLALFSFGPPPGVSPSGRPFPEASSKEASADVTEAWRWLPPERAGMGMPSTDDRGTAATYGNTFLVSLDLGGRASWQARRLGLRDVAPLLAPERIFAATDEGIAAFSRSDGRVVWDTNVGGLTSTPVLAAGRVVAALWDGGIVALAAEGGEQLWRIPVPGLVIGPPATDGRVVVVTWEAQHALGAGMVAVDATTGRVQWSRELPPDGLSAPAVTNGIAVAVAGDLAAHALSLDSGEERWQHEVGSGGSPEVPPLVRPGALLVATRLGSLHLLAMGDGAERWSTEGEGAAIRGGPVGCSDRNGERYALPVDDGRLLIAGGRRGRKVLDPPGRVIGVATMTNGWLLVATREERQNELVAYSAW